MKNFAKNLAALVKVKTIVTLVVLAVFTVLALRGDITPENVMHITTTVVVFYFGTQHEKTNANTEQITAEHVSLCPFMNTAELDGSIYEPIENDTIEGAE